MNRIFSKVHREEAGLSLAEMLVGIALAMTVTTLLVAGASALYKGTAYADQDSVALGSLRTAQTRLSQELREARTIYPTSNFKTVTFWIDTNRDFLVDAGERVTWRLVADGSKARLERITDAPGATATVHVRNLTYEDVFSYEGKTISTATAVAIRLRADAPGENTPIRTLETKVRMRNSDEQSLGVAEVDDGGDPIDVGCSGSKCSGSSKSGSSGSTNSSKSTSHSCGSCRSDY